MTPKPRFAGIFVLAAIWWLSADISLAAPMAAIVAKQAINLNGNALSADSYDSSDPAKSTDGYYDSTKYSGDMGDVVANDGLTNTLDVGDARIYGHVHIGPGAGMALGPDGAIGNHTWQATHVGTEPGWLAADANAIFPNVGFPYAADSAGVLNSAPGADIVTTAYNYHTNATTSAAYPDPVPLGGVVTNTAITNAATWPSPPPIGITTNTTYWTVTPWSAVPSPTPVGTVTNGPFITNTIAWAPGAFFTNTAVITTTTYPLAGTYIGSVVTNYNGLGQIQGYRYNHITGYAFHYYSYTYYTHSYSYPVYTYSYNIYTTNPIFITNHYDHVLNAGTSYYFNSLTGSTYVAGMAVRLVVANGIELAQPFSIPKTSAIAVWSGGTSITLSDNQVLNQSASASAFILYCAPTVTFLRLNTSGLFRGVILAPGADLWYNGAGEMANDFCGALLVNSLTLYGHVNFHFDEALNQAATNLNAPVWSSGNQFQFRVAGVAGFNYAVQASTNLTDWISLTTNTAPFTFADPDASTFPQRYYRSVYVP